MPGDTTAPALSGFRHEVRNCLATILNGIYVLRNSDIKGPIAEQTLEIIHQQVHDIARLLDGSSTGEDRVAPALAETTRQTSGPLPTAPEGRRLRIMLLEDNREGAKCFSRLLRLWGHDVCVAHDGAKALELIPEHAPDVGVIDLGLPDMDGFEFARRLRARFGDNIFLIALTGYGEEMSRGQSADAGFDRHLTKPVDPWFLRRLLTECSPS